MNKFLIALMGLLLVIGLGGVALSGYFVCYRLGLDPSAPKWTVYSLVGGSAAAAMGLGLYRYLSYRRIVSW